HSALVYTHIAFAFASYACFFLALGSSIAYLIRDRELKSKRRLRITRILPSLEKLDFITHRALLVGFPLLTLALILGALSQITHKVLGAGWLLDWRVATAVATWIMYAILIALRLAFSRRGRGVAVLTIAAFVIVILSFVILRARESKHRFGNIRHDIRISANERTPLSKGARGPWQ
ncbi:MAG: cytochrome c biogenesis protein CcsA, partial [Planctomycetota bacterium]